MSSSSAAHRPLYATSIRNRSQPRVPPLRRAATFLISRAGMASASLSQNPRWNEMKTQLGSNYQRSLPSLSLRRGVIAQVKPTIQFIRGVDEMVIPDVALTRSKDGQNGVATFVFDQPSVFDSSKELGDITGIYMIDDEGVLQSVDVSAKFLNGKPAKIEAKYVMKSVNQWDRFMRFMERYATENNLGFVKS